ncbi:MAG: SpvB/TcaC N-terminal domain-containing protein, partial [Bacteroidota bacterium]
MKKIRKYLIASTCMLLAITANGQQLQQKTGVFLEDNTPNLENTGNWEYIGQDKVLLNPGFSFTPSNANGMGNNFKAFIDWSMVVPTPYQQNIVNLDNRTLDYNLPVGKTAGSAGVTPSGAATYSIPIFTSPGTAGMKPDLSIQYNSQSGVGLLGWKWDLAGLSSISRIQKNYYYDQKVAPVDFGTDDLFALDGNRLEMTVGSVYGEDGTEYATLYESFSRIVANGYANNGPQWFTVYTKDGMILEYGNTADSRIKAKDKNNNEYAFLWRLNKVTDQSGNYMLFEYTQENGSSYISKIKYTGNANAGIEPYNEIVFQYTLKEDVNFGYVAGCGIADTKVLSGIKSVCEGSVVKNYQFRYTQNHFGQSNLQEITEAGLGGQQFNSTLINWGDQTDAFSMDFPQKANNVIGFTDDFSFYNFMGLIPLDFNGDGRQDFFGMWQEGGDTKSALFLLTEKNGNQYTYKESFHFGGDIFCVADDNNDGRDEYFTRYVIKNGAGDILRNDFNRYRYRPGQQWWLLDLSYSPSHQIATTENLDMLVGDFDGNGKPESVFYNARTGAVVKVDGSIPITAYTNASPAISLLFYSSLGFYSSNNKNRLSAFDFDGDGKQDILVITPNGNVSVYKYNAVSQLFELVTSVEGINPPIIDDDPQIPLSGIEFEKFDVYCGDFNGDGKSDLLCHIPFDSENKPWWFLYSDGKEFKTYDKRIESAISGNTNYIEECDDKWNIIHDPDDNSCERIDNHHFVADANGDGLSDIISIYQDGPTTVDETGAIISVQYAKKQVLQSQNNYKTEFLTETNTYTQPGGYTLKGKDMGFWAFCPLDFNWDAKSDLIWAIPKTQTTGISILADITFHKDENTNLAEVISDGMNFQTKFTYDNYVRHCDVLNTQVLQSIYDLQFNYPFARPITLATQMTMPDGKGGWKDYTYIYKNGIVNTRGLGFLGFNDFITNDIVNKTKIEATFYDKFFIESGRNFYFRWLSSTSAFANLSTLTTVTQSIPAYLCLHNGKTFVNYSDKFSNKDVLHDISNITVNSVNTDGLPNKVEKYYYDHIFGGPLSGGVPSGEILKTTEEITSFTSIANWHIAALPEGKISTSKRIGEDLYKRETSFEYYSNGQLHFQNSDPIVDPDDKQVITEFTYSNNLFGLPDQVTVSATGLAQNRFNNVEYDGKGRFVIKETDALNNTVERTFDPRFGNMLTTKSPDGLITRNFYDGFGRPVKTITPDGLISTLTYSWENSGTPPLAVYSTFANNSNAHSPDKKTWYDLLGRELKVQTEGMNGALFAENEYNEKGQQIRQSLPYYQSETPKWTVSTYDDYGRISTVNFNSLTTSYSYGTLSTTVTDPAGQISTKTMDATGQLTEATDNGGTVTYTYYSNGKPKTISDGSGTVEMEYDKYGLQKKLTDPDAGTTTYEYSALGELTKQTDAMSHVYEMVYDQLGRLYTKTEQGQQPIVYTYVLSGNGLGKPESITNADGKISYTYDNLGRMSSNTEKIEGIDYTYNYFYDDFGNVSDIIYPDGFGITNKYDDNGYFNNVISGNNNIWTAMQMTSTGKPERDLLGNNVPVNYSYDYYDNLNIILTGTVSDKKQFFMYSTDPATGNMSWRKDMVRNITESFTYDNLNRLTSATLAGQTPVSLTYQPNGNIATKDDAGNYAYHPDQIHALTKLTGNPNTVPENDQNIEYTSFSKVKNVTEDGLFKNEFIYGPDEERRVSILTDPITNTQLQKKVYVGSYEVVTDGVTEKKYHYINGSNGPVAIVITENGNDTYYYLCKDHLGSITGLLDQNGNMQDETNFDAWGRRRDPATWQYYTAGTEPAHILD